MKPRENNAIIRRVGTIKVTCTETGDTEHTALYSAREIVELLTRGVPIREIIGMLDDDETEPIVGRIGDPVSPN